MTVQNYNTNLFNKDGLQSTIAVNSRASIVKTYDGRICVIIDGEKHYADRNNLFGIDNNPQLWLETFIKEFDKEALKQELNAPHQKKAEEAQEKMDENTEAAKKSRTMQESIQKAISKANEAFWAFLKECGVHFKSALTGEKKAYAEKLNNKYWAERMNYVKESNKEYSLLMENCCLQSAIGKANMSVAFNNAVLER